jgi:hypothetical protein
VLRLPSIEDLYHTHGQTALIDATLKSLDDLSQTATLYGDHAFLAYVFTDGYNNASRNRPNTLKQRLNSLPANWTVAALVPGHDERDAAISYGFPSENVAIWDATSAEGVIEVGKTIQDATENFMQARSKGGFVGTRSLFSTGIDAINASTVRTALTPLDQSQYWVFPVHTNSSRPDGKFPIQDFLASRGVQFVPGHSYYQLTKTEKIQPQKSIAIRERSTGKVYTGAHARDVLGLPAGFEVKVKPDFNPQYDVFVQSTSTNRVLMPSTDLLVLR